MLGLTHQWSRKLSPVNPPGEYVFMPTDVPGYGWATWNTGTAPNLPGALPTFDSTKTTFDSTNTTFDSQ